MKRVIGIALLCVFSVSHAAVIGALINSEFVTTVTGKTAWKCTYNVMGQRAVVMLDKICPPTMNFE